MFAPPTTKRTLKVSDRGLDAHVAQVLHSMLAIVQGRSVAQWERTSPHEADVLFVGMTEQPTKMAQPIHIVVAQGENDPPEGLGTFALHYPFRVMQVLSLLDLIAEHFPTRPRSARSGWEPAESFYVALTTRTPGQTLRARAGNGDQIWLTDQQAWMLPMTWRHLCQSPLDLSVFMPTHEAISTGRMAYSLKDMGWHLGQHAPMQRPPWLHPGIAYQLQQWPDCKRLNLTNTSTLDQLARWAHRPWTCAEDPAPTLQLMTSLFLMRCLDIQPVVAVGEASEKAIQALSGWRHFISQLRRRWA